MTQTATPLQQEQGLTVTPLPGNSSPETSPPQGNAKWEVFPQTLLQLLFSEAIAQPKTMAVQTAPPCPASSPADPQAMEAADCILQKIATVGCHLEAMDSKISDLTVVSTFIRADIADFRETVNDLDRCLMTVEDQVVTLPDQEAELRSLQAKVIDLDDKSRRDNFRLFGIPEHKEGSDIKMFLKNLLPKLTGLGFSPPLEFQRVHRIGPLHKATSDKPRPIIACFLHHEHACQIISAAKSQGPYSRSGWQRISPD
ncbi:hypothetical protein NDU88_006257 [Pleurodeles waltl]|uniref:Uncharacterized protein n=1 Tax=Pleurodeles waltl TaxID=8319 RepID=A0AAV7UPH1_PLEWA|nr:hypothetical protein NDU88_006257 [Pleurodeles waltl]